MLSNKQIDKIADYMAKDAVEYTNLRIEEVIGLVLEEDGGSEDDWNSYHKADKSFRKAYDKIQKKTYKKLAKAFNIFK